MTEENDAIRIRLAVHRTNANLIDGEHVSARFYTPGEEVCSQLDFMR